MLLALLRVHFRLKVICCVRYFTCMFGYLPTMPGFHDGASAHLPACVHFAECVENVGADVLFPYTRQVMKCVTEEVDGP